MVSIVTDTVKNKIFQTAVIPGHTSFYYSDTLFVAPAYNAHIQSFESPYPTGLKEYSRIYTYVHIKTSPLKDGQMVIVYSTTKAEGGDGHGGVEVVKEIHPNQ